MARRVWRIVIEEEGALYAWTYPPSLYPARILGALQEDGYNIREITENPRPGVAWETTAEVEVAPGKVAMVRIEISLPEFAEEVRDVRAA